MPKSLIARLCLLIAAFSCGRIKKEGHEIANAAKSKVQTKVSAFVDKVIPEFDASAPDTKFNKQRFRDFFGFEPGADIHDLYCFDDAIGIDASYYFGFGCQDSTATRIIHQLNLHPDTSGQGGIYFYMGYPKYSWWDTSAIEHIRPYYNVEKDPHHKGLYQYFWFDKSTQKAYYLNFDL